MELELTSNTETICPPNLPPPWCFVIIYEICQLRIISPALYLTANLPVVAVQQPSFKYSQKLNFER